MSRTFILTGIAVVLVGLTATADQAAAGVIFKKEAAKAVFTALAPIGEHVGEVLGGFAEHEIIHGLRDKMNHLSHKTDPGAAGAVPFNPKRVIVQSPGDEQ